MAKRDLTLYIRAKSYLAGALSKAKKRLRAFGDSVKRIGRMGALAFAGMATAIVTAMVKVQEFNKALAQVATLTDMSFRKISKEVRKISAEFGLVKEEIIKGLYDALSAGIPKDNVFEFMRIAAKAARAGATSVATSIEATTRVIDAYGLSANDAKNVNDKLFKTVKKGVITYDQLAEKIGMVAGVAKQANIPLDDLLGVVATASKTVKAEQLFTGIRAAILSLSKTSKGAALITERGLGGALAAVADQTGNTLIGLRSVITEARALPVALAVSGDNASKFAENLNEVSDSADAMAEAFEKTADKNPLDKLFQSLHNIVLTAGDVALQSLAPTIERAAKAAAKFAENIADWFQNEKIQKIRNQIEGLTNALLEGGDAMSEVASAIGDVVVEYFKLAANKAVEILADGAVKIGSKIGESARKSLKIDTFGKNIFESFGLGKLYTDLKNLANGKEDESNKGPADSTGKQKDKKTTSLEKAKKELDKVLNKHRKKETEAEFSDSNYIEDRIKKIINNVGGQDGKSTTSDFDQAKDELEDVASFWSKIWKNTSEKVGKFVAESEKKRWENLYKKREDLEKRLKRKAINAQQEKIQGIKDELAARKRAANQTVKQFLDEKKQTEQHQEELKKDEERYNKIMGKRRRGIKATGQRKKEQDEFVRAFEKLQQQGGKNGINALEQQIAQEQKKLDQLRGNKTEQEMLGELKKVRREIKQIMTMG